MKCNCTYSSPSFVEGLISYEVPVVITIGALNLGDAQRKILNFFEYFENSGRMKVEICQRTGTTS